MAYSNAVVVVVVVLVLVRFCGGDGGCMPYILICSMAHCKICCRNISIVVVVGVVVGVVVVVVVIIIHPE